MLLWGTICLYNWHDKRAKHFRRLWETHGVLVVEDVKIDNLKVNVSSLEKYAGV
jgi:hypothetical protein